MKPILYTIIFLTAAGAVAYMVYEQNDRKEFMPTGNFEADDQKIYDTMRRELRAEAAGWNPPDTLAWFDDLAMQEYMTSFIGSRQSKALAYLNTLKKTNGVHPKIGRYTQLIDNLKKRYN